MKGLYIIMMEKNESLNDRITRLILGVVFVLTMIYFVTLNNVGTVELILAVIFTILALIMFVTSIIGSCPIYSALKKSTNNT